MRRRLLRRLPQLTQFYGLTPWDFERMTEREVSEYLVQMEKALADQGG
jgi:hypothetical protein